MLRAEIMSESTGSLPSPFTFSQLPVPERKEARKSCDLRAPWKSPPSAMWMRSPPLAGEIRLDKKVCANQHQSQRPPAHQSAAIGKLQFLQKRPDNLRKDRLPVHDLDEDNAVSVADVQIVINSALGMGCSTGGGR